MADQARLVLHGGPFDGHEVASLPPDLAAPAQIVWSCWSPHGFTAWLYEWRGAVTMNQGHTEHLIYFVTGRQLAPDEIPPLVAETAEVWADGADLIAAGWAVPPDQLWPGL